VLTLLILRGELPDAAIRVCGTDGPQQCAGPVRARIGRALAPYLAAQLAVLGLTLAWPSLVWHRNPSDLPSAAPASSTSEDEQRRALERQLEENADNDAKDAASDPAAKPR
jgi:hypothetical protein